MVSTLYSTCTFTDHKELMFVKMFIHVTPVEVRALGKWFHIKVLDILFYNNISVTCNNVDCGQFALYENT